MKHIWEIVFGRGLMTEAGAAVAPPRGGGTVALLKSPHEPLEEDPYLKVGLVAPDTRVQHGALTSPLNPYQH